MKFFLSWHKFIVRHFVKVNILLLLLLLFFLFNLRHLSFDADWLNLFSEKDSVYADYRQLTAEGETSSSIFLKLVNYPRGRLHSLRSEIAGIEDVSFVKVIDFKTGSSDQWLEVGVESSPHFSSAQKDDTVEIVKGRLQDAGIEYGITGAIPILEEYTESVKTDFIKTSLIALVLIILIIIYFFGFSLSVIFGFMYQGIGLLAAMFVFKQVYGSINSLAATLPCVLIGLGVDFVIHSIVAVDSSSGENSHFLGEVIYRKVSVPIFWGAFTTTLAFLSLLFADLKGLHSAGILGSLSIMGMFLFVILFLPAAVTRFHDRDRFRRIRVNITFPFINSKRALGAIILIVVCAALFSFTGRVRFEERVENLYNKEMTSLQLQDELSEELGVYPSKLYVSFETANPKKEFQRLSLTREAFIPDPESIRVNPVSGSRNSRVMLQIFPRKNPFSLKNFEEVRSRLDKVFAPQVEKTLRISGDAVLYHHLNDLLIKGMTTAFFAVFVFLALVLLALFRNVRFALSALTVLFVSTLATLGGFGLFSISLSAYTITLFPLFIGIGVDDCLHVLYLKRKGGRLVSGSSVLKAITLTTVTTVLCYGSLITAKNAGFNSIGKAAVLGLGLVFLCAVYLLPVFSGAGNNGRPKGGG